MVMQFDAVRAAAPDVVIARKMFQLPVLAEPSEIVAIAAGSLFPIKVTIDETELPLSVNAPVIVVVTP